MGTTYRVTAADPAADAARIKVIVEETLERVDAAFSTYRADAALARFNATPGDGWVAMPGEVVELLGRADGIHRISRGAFDPTVGPLVSAWGFGADGARARPPEEAERRAAAARVGWDRIELSATGVRRLAPGVELDLSAMAKGHAVDRVHGALADAGLGRWMVEVGGEVRVQGLNPDGMPWRIAVEQPVAGLRRVHRVIELEGGALATSGGYRRYLEADGRRYAHLLDPRSGEPVDHDLASVTVAHPSCAVADAWATALMVLGPDEGVALAGEQGLSALFLIREGGGWRERTTGTMEEMLAGGGEWRNE